MTKVEKPETGFVGVNGTKLYYEMLGEGHPHMEKPEEFNRIVLNFLNAL